MVEMTPLPAIFRDPDENGLDAKRIARGRLRMRDSRAIICGLARDVSSELAAASQAMEAVGEAFADYRVVVFENDSADDTQDLLSSWSVQNPRVTVLAENLGDPVNQPIRCLQRATRMASYRNRYLDHIAEHYVDYDYAIILDMDLGGGWSQDGIASTFGHSGWDFVGSYGTLHRHNGYRYVPVHYDAWAFRVLGDDRPMPTKVVNYMKPDFDDHLMPVNSCFGGLGVYRMPALLSARYSGEDCEHVTLHRRMRAAGYDRLFLNSHQTTDYGWREAKYWRMWSGLRDGLLDLGRFRTKKAA